MLRFSSKVTLVPACDYDHVLSCKYVVASSIYVSYSVGKLESSFVAFLVECDCDKECIFASCVDICCEILIDDYGCVCCI